MISDRLKERLRRDRPMVRICIHMPVDVVDDLKRIAPELGFSGYQPLLRSYVGRGLREDLARLEREQEIDALERRLAEEAPRSDSDESR